MLHQETAAWWWVGVSWPYVVLCVTESDGNFGFSFDNCKHDTAFVAHKVIKNGKTIEPGRCIGTLWMLLQSASAVCVCVCVESSAAHRWPPLAARHLMISSQSQVSDVISAVSTRRRFLGFSSRSESPGNTPSAVSRLIEVQKNRPMLESLC